MKSMTGYGAAEGKVGKGVVFIEAKSVNHRYCDILLKVPPRMNPLDPMFRQLIKAKCERGKIELFLKEKKGIAETRNLSLDIQLAKKYHKCLERLQKELGPIKKEIHLLEVIDSRELINIEDVDIDYSKYWSDIRKITMVAIHNMDKMRRREGAFLMKDQKKRLRTIKSLIDKISIQSKKSLTKYEAKIKSKIGRNFAENQNMREKVNSEIALLAEKLDIAEELTRLASHINQYHHLLNLKGAVGRQLDFLLQEMNREVNTVGSKSNDAKISIYVVNLKSELEKLREQVQNIE